MGFVIKGVRIPLPLKLSVMIINVAASLRLIDPPDRAPSVPAAKAPSPPPEGSAQSPSSSRQAIRSRSESTIGFERSKEPIDAAALAETKDEERLHLVVDLRTAPLIGVLLLLATTTIDGSVLRQGLGDETAKPYDVLVLFISLVSVKPQTHRLFLALNRPSGIHIDGPGLDRRLAGAGILHFSAIGPDAKNERAVSRQDREWSPSLQYALSVLVRGRRARWQ